MLAAIVYMLQISWIVCTKTELFRNWTANTCFLFYAVTKPGERVVAGVQLTWGKVCSQKVFKSLGCIKCFGVTYCESATVLLFRLDFFQTWCTERRRAFGKVSSVALLHHETLSEEAFVLTVTMSVRVVWCLLFSLQENVQNFRKLPACALMRLLIGPQRSKVIYCKKQTNKTFFFTFGMAVYTVKVRLNLAYISYVW